MVNLIAFGLNIITIFFLDTPLWLTTFLSFDTTIQVDTLSGYIPLLPLGTHLYG